MQSRVTFNAGEFAPEMALRADVEYYNKACQVLENWEVSQMGGVRRRKGMRFFADALSEDSILIPYTYSYAEGTDLRFVVEVSGEIIRVLNFQGEEQARFTSEENTTISFSFTRECRYRQVNALLFITSMNNPPLVLKYDMGLWSLELFDLKHKPWRHVYEQRDQVIQILRDGGEIDVVFPDDTPEKEKPDFVSTKDWLRASYWVEQQEAESKATELQLNVTVARQVPTSAEVGDKFVTNTDNTIKYWVCTNDWTVEANYVEGMDSPTNYPNNFVAVENEAGYEDVTAYYSVKDAAGDDKKFVKGDKLAIKAGYWEYYTCIKRFENLQQGYNKFTDYPGYFIQGIAVGKALPCKGEWVFYCSGTWVGCYVVRRNYETAELDGNWEDRGISFSRNDGLSNIQPSGTEAEEACYLRLFLTKSKRMSDDDITAGFPPDSTGNRLIVKGYKHDMVLTAYAIDDGSIEWECEDKIQTTWTAARDIKDWSWSAFGDRYGYPLICEAFNKRLVFASTVEQPQTVWLSKIDDINNFMTGSADDDAIALTMLTASQNPICWLKPRGDMIMLGTSEAEHVISSGNSAFSAKTASVRDHGYVGSQRIAALGTSDKMLYVERGGGRVYSFEYSLEIDGWRSSDLSIFAPHIAKEHVGFVRSSLIRKPDTVALYVLGDGQLALCTYNSMHEVKAWHRWKTNGAIKEVLGMPNGNANDRIFLIVKRENGVAIEVVDDDSPYHDRGEDYESLLTTNAMNNVLEAYVTKRHQPVVAAYIGESFHLDGDNLQVSTDGEIWYASDMPDGDIKRGWHKFIAPRDWKFEQVVSVRVRGEQEFNLLGLQA